MKRIFLFSAVFVLLSFSTSGEESATPAPGQWPSTTGSAAKAEKSVSAGGDSSAASAAAGVDIQASQETEAAGDSIIKLPPESVALSTGEIRKFEVPFVIQRHTANTSNVRILHVEGRSFEIEGISEGSAQVHVSAGGMSKDFRVEVSSSIMPIYRELSRELGDLPEVGVELSDNVLTLRGEITRPLHWEYFRRVVKRYEDRCRNYVTFQPGPALFEDLKKLLENAGYKVGEEVSPDLPGQLSFQVSNGILTVSGYLLCESDIEAVKRLLASQKWLSPEWNGNALRAVTELNLADTQLDVGIVFVGVTRTQLERLGNASADGTILSWNLIAWFRDLAGGMPPGGIDGSTAHGRGLYSSLNTDLKGSLVFFGNNGISDFRDAGHITLTNNSPDYSVYENGGTLNVKVYSQDTADLKPINFGLKMKVRGGLVRSDEVRLEFDLEKSLAPIKQDEDYFQRSTKTQATVLCKLNRTAVIAGQKELTYSDSGPGGYAFLRHIPVVNWFASSAEQQGEELQLLILACPRIAKRDVEMTRHPSEETAAVEKTISESTGKKNRKAHERENRNWILKMFTW